MSKVSSEYAEALFTLSQEEDCGKEYEESLETVLNAFDENPSYIKLLEAPSIPLAERLQAIDEAFSDSVSGAVVSFLKLLCKRGRISEFKECVEQYRLLLNELEKISEATVTSAVELSGKEKEELKKKLEKISGKTVTLECKVDRKILGGLIVEMDGKVMDSSLKRHLDDVKDVISR